jgi:hypothetical protein
VPVGHGAEQVQGPGLLVSEPQTDQPAKQQGAAPLGTTGALQLMEAVRQRQRLPQRLPTTLANQQPGELREAREPLGGAAREQRGRLQQ